ncbi:MAG TPA: cupin domain-containing protein [Usitatibacter sp.]|jgi:50S ribosomal protein L16 3-hydroxylase|nr:cupin domain-containing protein [Usitatibacter sp.]
MAHNPPAGLDPEAFMRMHWQREPLLVRRAFPAFRDPLSPREVLALAASPDATSRLVRGRGASWTLEHGPFSPARFKQLPRRAWTVLVQDTNHFSAAADALLSRFDFIPHARIDDVMVSYAVPGGSVGPHVDSYDVFLLQGQGQRRWQISRQEDRAFVPGLDLKILARFEPQEEWVLEAGDMLYLPPGISHYGIAETECLTWSIGFRAPADRDLVAGFLDFLRDRLEPEGQYRDPGEPPAEHPAEIPAVLAGHVNATLEAIRWTPALVREFTGRFLSEPKPHVSFTPPRRPLARKVFAKRAARAGVALDPRARLLFTGNLFFLNGESIEAAAAGARGMLRRLADSRRLSAPLAAPEEFWDVIHGWYLQGFVQLAEAKP